MFTLEAKYSANDWRPIEEIYAGPLPPGVTLQFATYEEAHLAKVKLKSWLRDDSRKNLKRPIRIREIDYPNPSPEPE